MQKLVDHIIAVADRKEIPLTAVKLQRILFLTIRNYLIEYGNDDFIKKIYTEPFEVGSYGPILPSIFDRFKIYSNLPLNLPGIYHLEYQIFDQTILNYLPCDIFKLIQITQQNRVWQEQQAKHQTACFQIDDIVPVVSIGA